MNSVYPEHMAAAMAAALAAKRSMAPENAAEVRRYMDKLKDLVPLCPKNRKVSKLELIQHVIDYISDLQDTLQSDSDSDSPPESPMEHVSFSDTYSSSPPMFQAYESDQQPSHHAHHTMQQSNFSANLSNTSCNNTNGGFNGFNNTGLSSSYSSAPGSASLPHNYNTIHYSDHGTSSTSQSGY